MENHIIEANYPIVFRESDSEALGRYIKACQSVVLIGMKRVGISNFLRFFIHHKDIVDTYIADSKNHLLIPVDLNDLVELEIYPFWTLTLKRIVDSLEKSSLGKEVRRKIETLFLDSIQSQDPFLTIDSVRKSLVTIIENGVLPTLFFIRFDRIKNAVTPEFFANLQGIKDATHHKLSYVFTSFRSLDALSPMVFSKASLSVFCRNMYIKPATKEDTKVIFKMYKEYHKIALSSGVAPYFFDIVDGYVQYLQLALISLDEANTLLKSRNDIFEYLAKDERIALASEELWESLGQKEKDVLVRITGNEKIIENEREEAKYLWDTGIVVDPSSDGSKIRLFSPLFETYVKQGEKRALNHITEFTKKENLLFNFLKSNNNGICEREKIVEAVWPEVESLGVSDWAIDRLVARVRNKLRLQKSNFEIQTVKSRGYKLATT